MLRAMTGELSAAEAHRMVMEKQLAVIRAQLAYTESILNGEAASALGAYFDVYQRAVESNRKRLSNRRWRWARSGESERRSSIRVLLDRVAHLSFPKIPSGADSRHEAESAHHST
jgi:hypothetical protein